MRVGRRRWEPRGGWVLPALAGLTALALVLAAPGRAGAVLNEVDDVPAATLLLPYFEVDLDDPAGVIVWRDVKRPNVFAFTCDDSTAQAWIEVRPDPGGRLNVLQRPAQLDLAGP